MQYRYIDIFAGCGGLSLGLCNAGWSGLFAIEKNANAFSTLHDNLITKKKHFTWVDWLNVSNHDIDVILAENKTELEKMCGEIPLIVGGPPCQGFSMAGQRNENDHRNKLVKSYIEFVSIIKPQYIFFENVHGFTIGFLDKNQNKTRAASSYIINKLKKLGYNVDCKVLDLSDYGVPQRRKRFILIGCLNGTPQRFFEILSKNVVAFLKEKGLNKNTTVSDAIGDLLLSNGRTPCPDSKGFMSGKYGKAITKYQEYIRSGIKDSVGPDSHRFANHKEDTVKLFTNIQSKCEKGKRLSLKNTVMEGFKRRGITVLVPDQPCNTITTIPDDYLHYCEPRIMTVRECARMQTFPDWYEFKGKYTTGGILRKIDVPRYTQVGNAIPPLFAEQVGLALKEMIESEQNE